MYDSPFQYFWDGNLGISIEDTINYLLDLKLNNFDIIETPLDLDHYKELCWTERK